MSSLRSNAVRLVVETRAYMLMLINVVLSVHTHEAGKHVDANSTS